MKGVGQWLGAQGSDGVLECFVRIVGLLLLISFGQGGEGDLGQVRLVHRVDGVTSGMEGDLVGATDEGAEVEVSAHLRAVVDGVVVPEKGLSPETLGHGFEVVDGVGEGADLGTGPEDVHGWIEALSEVLEVVGGALAEDLVEFGIVGVVGGTHDDLPRCGGCGGAVGGVDLNLGNAVEVAFHVVEEDGEDVRRELVELANLVFEKLDGFVVVLKMEFVEIDPDAEGDSGFPVDFTDFPEARQGDVRQGFVPFFAKEAVAFGGVDVVVVAVSLEEGCVVGTGGPGPLAAEEAFDSAEILHGERSGILGYINYENYGSSGKGAVIDGIFFRFRLRYLPKDVRKLAPLVIRC